MKFAQGIRLILCGLAAINLGTPEQASGAAKKRVTHRTSAAAPKKLSNTEVLVNQLAINSALPGENLAQTCRRISFRNLATALNMNRELLHQEKGEYETSDQFAERVGKLANAINFTETVFCQPLNDNEDLPFTYNADAQRFQGSVSNRQNVWRDVKQLGSYRSKTAMGATATVHSSLDVEYSVVLEPPTMEDDEACGLKRSRYSSFAIQLPYPLERAPALKAAGYLVVIGKLVAPYIDYEEQEGNPTLTDPYDEYEVSMTLHLAPSRFVVVDGSGGEVWTCSPGRFAPNRLAAPKGNPGSWITIADYPSIALREHHSGQVGVAVSVGVDGQVMNCSVTRSSGFPELDAAACDTIGRRSRFSPATDAQGNPTAGTWTNTVVWSLPD